MKSYKYLSLLSRTSDFARGAGVFSCQDKGYTDIINPVVVIKFNLDFMELMATCGKSFGV